jgi:hypothetical protein
LQTLVGRPAYCGAVRRTGHSLQPRYPMMGEFTQCGTKQPFLAFRHKSALRISADFYNRRQISRFISSHTSS